MNGIVTLVRLMRPSEKRLLLHYYTRNVNAESKMRLKLFRLINSGVETDTEAREKLKSPGSASSYSHLKSRLKDDILNILLMQDTSKRLAQPNRAAELDCRKKVAQSHLLLLRGASVEGMKLIKSALKEADKYELIAERLQINQLLREKFLGVGASQDLANLNTAINEDLLRYEALLKVQEKSFVLASPEFAKTLKSRSKDKQNLELIDELRKLYVKHKLARIGFWYYMAATEYYSAKKSHQDVIRLGLKFIKLVEESPAVRSKTNIAGVNQTVGFAFLQSFKYPKAIEHLGVSSTLFPTRGFNRLTSLELLVKSQLAANELQGANATVVKAISHPRIELRENLKPKWLFIKACVEFRLKEHSQSFKTINSDGFLLKQVDAWNVQYRLLEMLQLVEFLDEEWLEFKLDATKKFLNRHKELITPRVKLAVNLISHLSRHELSTEELSVDVQERLNLSLKSEGEYVWNPSGPELVRVDTWFQSKLTTQDIHTE